MKRRRPKEQKSRPGGIPLSTVYLGVYPWEMANQIAGDLEDADIAWWYKQPGFLSQIWEFGGIRLFVDKERLQQAKEIAARRSAGGDKGSS